LRLGHRNEFLLRKAVMDDLDRAARGADPVFVDTPAIGAFEYQKVRAHQEQALERQEDQPRGRRAAIMKAAAVRRVDAQRGLLRHEEGSEAGVSATFGAVAVEDIDGVALCKCRDATRGGKVSGCRPTGDGEPRDAQLHERGEHLKALRCSGAAADAVRDYADRMSSCRLPFGEIADVTEKPAD